jgi:simple sugar transport system permease protein
VTVHRRATLAHRLAESKVLFPVIALGLILVFDLFAVPGFFALDTIDGHLYGNLVDIPRNGSTIMLLALGMTLVIATGGIDLSVGAIMAISASVAAIMIQPDLQALSHDPSFSQFPLPVVVLVTLAVATLCGVWNGVLVAYAGIQPMVATLILMIAGRGIVQIFYEPYGFFGNGWVVLPVSLFIVAIVFTLAWLGTRRTALGTFTEAVGINARSSFYSGINEKRVKLFAYTFCGLCAGIAGIVASSSIRTSDANNIGLDFELDAILAVVIGGTALAGGRFSLFASLVGALVIQAITTSMYAVGVPASGLLAIKGFVVILVILLFSVQVRDWVRGLTSRRSAAA